MLCGGNWNGVAASFRLGEKRLNLGLYFLKAICNCSQLHVRVTRGPFKKYNSLGSSFQDSDLLGWGEAINLHFKIL